MFGIHFLNFIVLNKFDFTELLYNNDGKFETHFTFQKKKKKQQQQQNKNKKGVNIIVTQNLNQYL